MTPTQEELRQAAATQVDEGVHIVTDTLRDRIAIALKTANDRVAGFIGYDEMADAVIAELGLQLHREVGYPHGWTFPRQIRYVTDWMKDE